MTNRWSNNLFLGRIGEALVESVLSDYGYRVTRTGGEFRLPGSEPLTLEQRTRPDFWVFSSSEDEGRYVEVKARSWRPMRVLMGRSEVDNINRIYPDTLMVFVSSYDGSLNCAPVSEITADMYLEDSDDMLEFDLTRDGWRPIWDFFPRINPDEELADLWKSLTNTLEGFGNRRVQYSKGEELYEDELQSLKAWVDKFWEDWMPDYGLKAKPEIDSRAAYWELVREMNSILLVAELFGGENFGTREFLSTWGIAKGEKGEGSITLDLQEIFELIGSDPANESNFRRTLSEITSRKDNAPSGSRLLELIAKSLPAGVGKAYIPVEGSPLDEALEVDLRTAWAMARGKNRLDRPDNKN